MDPDERKWGIRQVFTGIDFFPVVMVTYREFEFIIGELYVVVCKLLEYKQKAKNGEEINNSLTQKQSHTMGKQNWFKLEVRNEGVFE